MIQRSLTMMVDKTKGIYKVDNAAPTDLTQELKLL
jgi:hypothetical protein